LVKIAERYISEVSKLGSRDFLPGEPRTITISIRWS